MGIRRRESSGACLGRVARLQDRQEAQGQRRSRIPAARLPQADAELHLVGEPQRRRRHEHLPGRLSRPRQHRRIRPQRSAADRRLHRTVRRHQLDGDVHPESAGHRAGTGDGRTLLRRRGQQILGALHLHRQRHEPSRRRQHGAVERGRRLLLRRAQTAGRHTSSR